MDLLSRSLSGKPHFVALSDREGWILTLSGSPEEFGGRKAGLAIGANWSEKYIGNGGIGTTLHTKEPTLVYGPEHFTKDYRGGACLGAPIFDSDGQILGVLNLTVPTEHAIPDRISIILACAQSIEEALFNHKVLQTRLDQVEKLLSTGTLLATTVHDLRNPMAIIRGISQLGEMNAKSAKEKEYFQRIINQIDILLELLENLRSRHVDEKPEEIWLETLLHEVIEDFNPLLNIHGIKLELDCVSTRTTIHRDLFLRALHNLFKNAIQHMPDGGILTIATRSGEDISLTITDTGPGIPPEIKNRLFEPFVTSTHDGTGLGLYLVHYVVTKVHKGSISCQTGADGTSFHIKFPKANEVRSPLSEREPQA